MARCPKCGTLVVVKASGYLPSHNAPPNADGYVARCGNRQPKRTNPIPANGGRHGGPLGRA